MSQTKQTAAFRISYEMPHCEVFLFGNQCRTAHAKTPCSDGFRLANELGAQPHNTYRVVAPSNESGDGFGVILVSDDEETVFAEGVLLHRPNSCAFIEHADCPVVVMHNQQSKETVVHHAGRPALTPYDGENIVTTALKLIARRDDLDELLVYITGSICGTHFDNRDGAGQQHATRILEEFGPEVFTNLDTLAFSPAALVARQLEAAGLQQSQIHHDGYCTYSHPELSSHRQHLVEARERSTCNLTLVKNI